MWETMTTKHCQSTQEQTDTNQRKTKSMNKNRQVKEKHETLASLKKQCVEHVQGPGVFSPAFVAYTKMRMSEALNRPKTNMQNRQTHNTTQHSTTCCHSTVVVLGDLFGTSWNEDKALKGTVSLPT